ncbi:MAG: dihydroorotase, partial [Paludibacteraceae bacterium]|nr:dihydroorotase [Paludibacteraceae bacterium]
MLLINNGRIVNEGRVYKGSILVKDGKIEAIYKDAVPNNIAEKARIINAEDCWILPGVIDTHVHFRDPGLTHKGDLLTESKAAAAGGVTSIMDMPNTNPQTITVQAFEEKCQLASTKSLVNYSFYLGATNSNFEELQKIDPSKVCGIKLFMGSSTGNMLVDKDSLLHRIFAEIKILIAIHSEDEGTVKANTASYKEQFGDNPIPIKYHAAIRSTDACYKSTSLAVELAKKYGTRLHVLHLSTSKELALFENIPLDKKHITAETCPHYLLFDDKDYDTLGARIKCNPSIKSTQDKDALLSAINTNKIDTIGTDHAPHLLTEKEGDALTATSGMPQVQHALVSMLEFVKQGKTTIENVVDKMSHNPARLFQINKRGFIRKGYYADLVVVQRNASWQVNTDTILSKCGWSPYEGKKFSSKVTYTIINGNVVY